MKKILFSCLLLLGISITAQTIVFQDNFDREKTFSFGTWTSTNLGILNSYPYNAFVIQEACPNEISGKSMQIVGAISDTERTCSYKNISGSNLGFRPLVYHEVAATFFTDLKLSYKWRCGGEVNADYGQLVYSTNKQNWIPLGERLQGSTAVASVEDLSLPAALNNTTFYIGWVFYANASNTSEPGLTIDNVVIKGTTPTTCTGAPVVGTATISSDKGIIGNEVLLNSTGSSQGGGISYQWETSSDNGANWTDIPYGNVSSLYYTPTGNVGNVILFRLRVSCADSGQSSYSDNLRYRIDYCTVGPLFSGTDTYPITSVKIADLEKKSVETSDTTTPAHEYFLEDENNFNVAQEENVTMDVKVNGGKEDPYEMGVSYFIDWNHDGDFDDEGESFNNTNPLSGTGTAENQYPTIRATFTVPATATLGNTRMRIKTNAIPLNFGSLGSACSSLIYGQAEDHILNVKEKSLSTSDLVKKELQIYPNPFKNTLNISNVDNVKSISIVDASGRTVKDMKPAKALDVSSLKPGLYLVIISNKDGSTKTFKAVKE